MCSGPLYGYLNGGTVVTGEDGHELGCGTHEPVDVGGVHVHPHDVGWVHSCLGVLRAFFERLAHCDVLFVMNEDRKGVTGYVGAATFAELSYAVVRNLHQQKPVQVIVLQPVGDDVHGADEINLWHDLGWITFHSDT